MTFNEKWYCNTNGQRVGPLSADQLGTMLQQGAVSTKDLVRRENETEWVRVEEIQEYLPQPSLASSTKSDDLSDNFDSPPPVGLSHNADVGNEPETVSSSDSNVGSIDDWLEELPDASPGESPSRNDLWDSNSQHHTPGRESPSPPPSEPCFFRHEGTQELGPFPLSELQKLIDRGELQRTDRIRPVDSPGSLPSQDVPELVFGANTADDSQIREASSLMDELFAETETSPSTSGSSSAIDLSDLGTLDENAASVLTESDFQAPNSETWAELNTLDAAEESQAVRNVEQEPEVVEQPSPASTPVQQEPAEQEPVESPTPVQLSPPTPVQQSPAWEPPPKPKPAKKASRKKSSGGGVEFAMPSPALLMVLGGLLVVAALYYLWPSSPGGTHGQITIDSEPLKVGSLSLFSDDGEGKAMSFSVVEGTFSAADSLPDGKYNAIVVVGDRLGLPVPQLENTPQKKYNGARFRFTVQIDPSTPSIQMDLTSGEAELMKKKPGESSGWAQ